VWAVAVGVILLTLFVAGFLAYVRHSLAETSPDQPFLSGAPQNPDALRPLVCGEPCFGVDTAYGMAVTRGDISMLAVTDLVNDVGESAPRAVAETDPGAVAGWIDMGGTSECAFIPSSAPYIAAEPDASSRDMLVWMQTWTAGNEVMDLSARVFTTSEDASAFMHDVHARVAGCPWVNTNIPTQAGLDTVLVQVTAQAAIDVPDEVAAVGWVREGQPGDAWRSYVWDLQRGNLVVQARVITDGRVTEPQVAEFSEGLAQRLTSLPQE